MTDNSHPTPRLPAPIAYLLVVGLPGIGLILALRAGGSLGTPNTAWPPIGDHLPSLTPSALGLRLDLFLAQIIVILVLSRLLGRTLQRVGQPFVVGEMIAGLLLGPSVLGLLWPDLYVLLFPTGSVRFLGAVSQLGLLLFMFLVGLELRPEELRGRGHAAVLASHASIVTPLFLGVALALPLYPLLGMPGVAFPGFALFLGAAMSVTAFPVLARILSERGLKGTHLGAVALACAAVDDVTAWCVLAIVVAVAGENVSPRSLITTFVGTAAYVVAMLVLARPLLAALAKRHAAAGRVTHGLLTAIVVIALGSAWVTQRFGVHALLGAFLAGVVMPKNDNFVRDVSRPFEDIMVVLLLPLFFATTGIRTTVGLITSGAMWTVFLLLLAFAVVGKLGGSAVAARIAGLSWRESLSLGALMNSRGLMGLVILEVGVEIGVVSSPLFVMIVLMSVITTMMTTPMLSLIDRHRSLGAEPVVAVAGADTAASDAALASAD